MTQHLFLTGERQVGKTTLVDKVLARLGLPAGGFRTFGANFSEDGSSDVCIRGEAADSGSHRVAHRGGSKGGRNVFTEVFDRVGAELLRPGQCCRILVMDELGFMEADAHVFQKAVLDCLDGDTPVLGVIKPQHSPFLDRIRAHSGVQVVEVDPASRDGLAARIKLGPEGFRVEPRGV